MEMGSFKRYIKMHILSDNYRIGSLFFGEYIFICSN